jgi:hypothetical protein
MIKKVYPHIDFLNIRIYFCTINPVNTIFIKLDDYNHLMIFKPNGSVSCLNSPPI